MKFTSTALAGVVIVEIEPLADERGLFARSFCATEFEKAGLNPRFTQCNISSNRLKGTLRGMHYQAEPHAETKLVRCTRGRIFDVAVDLRPDSPSFKHWFGLELDAEKRNALYIPEGCAHGFQTLTDEAEVFYQMGADYVPGAGRGVRWNDPAFGIDWPLPPVALGERDATYPDFVP
jgi:dTDP-4-dehydrorhamnose 3,5-epimerase